MQKHRLAWAQQEKLETGQVLPSSLCKTSADQKSFKKKEEKNQPTNQPNKKKNLNKTKTKQLKGRNQASHSHVQNLQDHWRVNRYNLFLHCPSLFRFHVPLLQGYFLLFLVFWGFFPINSDFLYPKSRILLSINSLSHFPNIFVGIL